ncbi:MAG: nucleotidyltransferase substrate binding protein [Desulfosarcina sp.]|nr:nucleotidyltransferase substrate binding protein [Desulfobacterales bacterium]
MKDLLFYEGYDERTPRGVIRRAFEAGYLDEVDTEIWLDALDKRNILSHTYEEKVAEEVVGLIRNQYTSMLRRVLNLLRKKQN